MKENLEKVKLLARDLRNGKEFPRSPRETLGGYVLAARAVDKCRAVLVGWQGEYHSNCPLDQRWLKFAEINYDAYRSFVATGATDDEVAAWIGEHAKKRSRADIVIWNNKERDLRLSDRPRNCRNTWRTTSRSTSRAIAWCTTGSMCTTLKRSVSKS